MIMIDNVRGIIMCIIMCIILFLIFCCLLFLGRRNRSQQNNSVNWGGIDNERQTPTYEDLLLRSEWKAKRDCILKRDNNKCQWCGKQENLQVHHKYYSKYPNNVKVQPWNYPNDALITLCDECHQKAHKKKIKVYYRRYTDNY